MADAKGLSKIKVIKDYFASDTKASEFMKELKALDDTERLELAQGAALNMGLTQDEVAFPLS
jgi:hypothetical protein